MSLPAHRRPFADMPIDDLLSMLDDAPPLDEVVIRAELARLHPLDEPGAQIGMVIATLTKKRLAMSTADRVEGFGDHLVELAEHAAGLLHYDKSTSPGRYAVALRQSDGRWARFECLRLAGGTFEATAKGVHPNLNFALARSSKGGRKAGPGGRLVEMWGGRVSAGDNDSLEALLGPKVKRADLVRQALALKLWLATDGAKLLDDVDRIVEVVRKGVGPLRSSEVDQLEQLANGLRGVR